MNAHLKTCAVMLGIIAGFTIFTLAFAGIVWATFVLCAAVIVPILVVWYISILHAFQKKARCPAARVKISDEARYF